SALMTPSPFLLDRDLRGERADSFGGGGSPIPIQHAALQLVDRQDVVCPEKFTGRRFELIVLDVRREAEARNPRKDRLLRSAIMEGQRQHQARYPLACPQCRPEDALLEGRRACPENPIESRGHDLNKGRRCDVSAEGLACQIAAKVLGYRRSHQTP